MVEGLEYNPSVYQFITCFYCYLFLFQSIIFCSPYVPSFIVYFTRQLTLNKYLSALKTRKDEYENTFQIPLTLNRRILEVQKFKAELLINTAGLVDEIITGYCHCRQCMSLILNEILIMYCSKRIFFSYFFIVSPLLISS